MRSVFSIVVIISVLFYGAISSPAYALNQTYQVYGQGSDYYLKTDPNWVPISGDIFIIIPFYQDGEIFKLSQSNGAWQVENVSFSQFNAVNPTIRATGTAGYADFNGDGVEDLSVSLGGSGGNQIIRLTSVDYQSSAFDFYDLLSGITVTSYTYDALGRLVEVYKNNQLETEYSYDAAGNRKEVKNN